MTELTPAIPPATALVTGAGQRIGRAIALALGRDGWSVAVHYCSSRTEAEGTARDIEAAGGRAVAIRADLAREADTAPLIARAAEALGAPVTCLVNNASVFEDDRVNTMTRQSWDKHIETNLRAPMALSQAMADALPGKSQGVIVNLLDQAMFKPTPEFLSYHLSKAGLWWLTRTLAQALAPRIRVMGIGPGPTLRNPRQSEAHFAQQVAATPLKRGATPDEIAATVRYILAMPALTGQMIALDGGQHLAWQTGDEWG
jgi:NAD(P)-dependent dehydrogenase (short-subunit alcohol dehydrogenase family)